MPPDRLIGTPPESRNVAARDAETAVRAVLAGTPITTAAARIGLPAAHLADAVELYQAAGQAALAAQTALSGWYQVHVAFPDRATAETAMASQVHPPVRDAEAEGTIDSWWFVRKTPFWRLRFQTTRSADTQALVRRVLDDMTAKNLVTRWWPGIYEPETAVFGGTAAMDIAHQLFHADSSVVLDYLHRHDAATSAMKLIGRRELSLLLCSALMRAAGQDWHEQGDIWHRVTQMRPLDTGQDSDRIAGTTRNVRRLLTLDTGAESDLFAEDKPLTFARPWFTAFTTAGSQLASAVHDGSLRRGIRDVLAHHVIFHWNRFGLSGPAQAVLAQAAADGILGSPVRPVEPQAAAADDVART